MSQDSSNSAGQFRKVAFNDRKELRNAKRIVVKVGSAVITRADGNLATSHLTSVIEQIADLQRHGNRELLLVTSGAVAFGYKKIGDEIKRSMSLRDIELSSDPANGGGATAVNGKPIRGPKENRAAAACGQSSLMSFYDTMFGYQNVNVAQVLVTKSDLLNDDSRTQLLNTVRDLLSLKIVPIINTNDAVEDRVMLSKKESLSASSSMSSRTGGKKKNNETKPETSLETGAKMHDIVLEDNDALASLLASELHSDLLILLTNVDGIFTEPPSSKTARFLSTFHAPSDDIGGIASNPELKFGQKSSVGAGGMESKIRSALWALERGTSVVICNGNEDNALTRVVSGVPLGTFFVATPPPNDGDQLLQDNDADDDADIESLFEDLTSFDVDVDSELSKNGHKQISRSLSKTSLSKHGTGVSNASIRQKLESIVDEARRAGQILSNSLTSEERRNIIENLANSLEKPENVEKILEANKQDLDEASESQLAAPLLARLKLNDKKLSTLAAGLRQIAASSCDLVNITVKRTLLARDGENENATKKDLILEKVTCPIGVLLVIFESRPDCLPQLAALAIATGNALLAKGGKEATRSNRALMTLIRDALSLATPSGEPDLKSACNLLTKREQVNALLACLNTTNSGNSNINGGSSSSGGARHHLIDLIIPRGSNQLVKSIQQQAAGVGVPVLGHSEGVCHVYIDESASIEQAVKVVVDAKCNYPAACNAVETVLVHRSHIISNMAHKNQEKKQSNADADDDVHVLADGSNTLFAILVKELDEKRNVKINGGPRLYKTLLFKPPKAGSMRTEYSDLELTIEMVDSVEQAIDHINTYGSGHTDTIVTNDTQNAQLFLNNVDSSSVFWNASTRFADGYRFGLGAEVGISTGKVHARGPVGADGLLTYKWILKPSTNENIESTAFTVEEIDARGYVHESLTI